MKLWLQNILACPICKNHPLKLFILEWGDLVKSDNKNLKDFFKVDINKKIISPPSLTSIYDLSKDSENKQRIEVVKEFSNKVDISKSYDEILNSIGKNLDKILESIYLLQIQTGALLCDNCGRWYPIGSSIKGIPEMLPDDLRDLKKDQKFIEKWKDKLPKEIESKESNS